ncbi:hypothetical protein HDU78_001328 [Chytriomyces hyalinus]|nr:hypothetical protein HDU78_001328 [Chytriomyces hyalinus]
MKDTNITLAFVASFCTIPQQTTNGSYLTSYLPDANPSIPVFENLSGFIHYCDVAMDLAVKEINANPNILPNVYVNVKRFSDCGGWYPTVESFTGHDVGFPAVETAEDIVVRHPDVIGVIGDQWSSAARTLAEEFTHSQIPMCACQSNSPIFSDKSKYPYFWRTIPSAGFGTHLYQVLKSWNVKRIALIVQDQDNMSVAFAKDIKLAMLQHGIQIVCLVNFETFFNEEALTDATMELKRTSARYIVVSGQSPFIARATYKLSQRGVTGPDIVWMSYGVPQVFGDPVELLGPDYEASLSGFISIMPMQPSEQNPVFKRLFEKFIVKAQVEDRMSMFDFANVFWLQAAYDCAMMMLLGFDALLKNSPEATPQMLASRQLQGHMNYSLFKNLSYYGATLSDMQLTDNGDLQTPYQAFYHTGKKYDSVVFGETDFAGTNFSYYPNSKPVFYGGSSIPPKDGPEIPTIYEWSANLSNKEGVVLVVLFCTSMILTLLCLYLTMAFSKKRTIRRSSTAFLIPAIFSMALLSASILLHFGQDSLMLCKSRMWLQVMGFSLLMTLLDSKCYIDYCLCLSGKSMKKNVRSTLVILQATALAVNACLLTLWTVFGEQRLIQSHSRDYFVFACDAGGYSSRYNIVLLSFNAVLLFSALYFSYLARDADAASNESTFSGVIALTFSFAAIIMIPVLTTAAPGRPAVMMSASTTWILLVVTLAAIFGPKAIMIAADQKRIQQELSALLKPRQSRASSPTKQRYSATGKGRRVSSGNRMATMCSSGSTTSSRHEKSYYLGCACASFQHKKIPWWFTDWEICHVLVVCVRGRVLLHFFGEATVRSYIVPENPKSKLAAAGVVRLYGPRWELWCHFVNDLEVGRFLERYKNITDLARK